jgi:hypothetical protein
MRPVGAVSRIMGFAVACAALLSATTQAAPEMNKAVVRAVRGTANYSTDRGANWKNLKVGTSLNQNSVVRTAPGSTVDLYLNENGPAVRVTENTTLGIDKLTIDRTGADNVIETQLDLKNGRILGNVRKLAAASKYEVKTPQGVAGIRGTRYDISADGTVRVIEGQVVVVYIVNGQASTATVNAGQVARPPTQGGGQVVVNMMSPTEIQATTQEINDIATTKVIVEGGSQTVVTVEPVRDGLVEGDPANLPETTISGGGGD